MSAPKRFKVTLRTLHRQTLSYTVCTLLDERKAIALTAQVHLARVPDDQLYEVLSVDPLAVSAPEAQDIIDRAEW